MRFLVVIIVGVILGVVLQLTIGLLIWIVGLLPLWAFPICILIGIVAAALFDIYAADR